MNMRNAMSAQELYEDLAEEQLRAPEVSLGRALSNNVLKANGKIFAFLKGDRLVVKLPAARCGMLLAAGAVPFESGGRKMKEWVAVADQAGWPDLMDEARIHVAGK
jgi:hypothetical protein